MNRRLEHWVRARAYNICVRNGGLTQLLEFETAQRIRKEEIARITEDKETRDRNIFQALENVEQAEPGAGRERRIYGKLMAKIEMLVGLSNSVKNAFLSQ
jgi:hypothetical protein